ncbi:MAG: hypothetical protein U9O94_10990 [Nanoarchaeota archaeon]|nr:hypothetical protein [Nanoarchaeota archaeon]
MKKLIYLFMILWMVPVVYGASINITSPDSIIQGDDELVLFSILTDTLFSGNVYLSYNNLESSVTTVSFDNNSFVGAGPYIYTYSWDLSGVNVGTYSISADLEDSVGTTVDTDEINGEVNSSAPIIISKSPNGIVTRTSTTLDVKTNEGANCRYSTVNTTTYGNMSYTFSVTGDKTHTKVISSLTETQYKYYVSCEDSEGYVMNESVAVSFSVDLPPSAEISLSESSPLKSGTIEVTVLTSENIENAPILQYSFNDAPTTMNMISLTGSNSKWEGYMIIKEGDDNKVGTFYFSAKDELGTVGNSITEGKIFLVDTSKPPAPLNLEAITMPKGDIKLKWYYEGEDIEEYSIYRSTSSGIDYIDFYTSTGNGTQYIDRSTSDKVTYYYKVSAVDTAGNTGPLSSEAYATSVREDSGGVVVKEEKKVETNEPKVLPPSLVIKVNDMIKKMEQLEIDVKDVSSRFEGSGSEQKDLIDELGLEEVVTAAKNKVSELKSKLEALKLEYKTSSELDSELNNIDLEIKRIRKTTPKEVTLSEKAEFMQIVTEEDIGIAVNELFPLFSKDQKKDYIHNNKNIQDKLNIEANIKVITTRYMDETSKEETIIKKKITSLNPEPFEDVIVMEIIPKAVAEDIDEILLKTDGHEIVKRDPIVKWGFLSLSYDGEEIEYSIGKKVNIDLAKRAKTVVLLGPVQFEKESNKVVGFSIFGLGGDLSGTERFSIYLGIVVVALLAGYYVVFLSGRGMVIREKIGSLRSIPKRNWRSPNRFSDSYKYRGVSSRTGRYPRLKKIELDNSSELKSRRVESKDRLSAIKDLILEAQEYLSMEEFDKAEELYPQITILYRDLPKEHKSKIFPHCVELQKSIKEVKEEIYKSIL